MFDVFRSRDKAVRYVLGGLLALVAVSMVITLIPGYGTPSGAPEQMIAEIGKDQITIRQVQMAMQNVMRNKLIQPEMIQHYAPQLIDQMIAERAMAFQAERMGFRVSEKELADAIRSMTAQLFPNGEFDKEVYGRFLAQQGLTIPEFEKNIRSNLLVLKLQNLALEGAIVTPNEVEAEYRKKNDKVKLEYVSWTPADLRSKVNLTPAEIQNSYNQNKAQFMAPEKKSFHLLVADEAKIGPTIQMNETDLRAAYGRKADRYRTPERVKARHILIKTAEVAKEKLPELEAKARGVLKQVRAGGNFAELAKTNSDDPGSAAMGGDLGWVVRGQMVPPFEKATFALKPNEISDIVKTDYGFHIVQAMEREPARVRPFEEVKEELATEARKEVVYQRLQSSIDQARAELAKDPKQAEQIAAKYGLAYFKAEKLTRGESVPEVGTNAELDANLAGMKAGEVSPVLQVAPTKLAVAAVTEVIPPRQQSLAELESRIRDTLIGQRAQQLADQQIKQTKEKLAAAGSDLAAVAKSLGTQAKTTAFFTVDTTVDGIGPGTYVADAFSKPVGSTLAPFNLGNLLVLAKVIDKQSADTAGLATGRDAILLSLKKKKAGERRELFEDGLITQLIKEGKIKKNQENIKRLVTNYQG
ncbi:MAG: peptidyl-prolyl cis-trans isomerase [Bryobacteraceae bacterium]